MDRSSVLGALPRRPDSRSRVTRTLLLSLPPTLYGSKTSRWFHHSQTGFRPVRHLRSNNRPPSEESRRNEQHGFSGREISVAVALSRRHLARRRSTGLSSRAPLSSALGSSPRREPDCPTSSAVVGPPTTSASSCLDSSRSVRHWNRIDPLYQDQFPRRLNDIREAALPRTTSASNLRESP